MIIRSKIFPLIISIIFLLFLSGKSRADRLPAMRLMNPQLIQQRYGYTQKQLYEKYRPKLPSHFLLTYPRHRIRTENLPPPDFEIKIGQQLINQLAIGSILEVSMDKYRYNALPIELIKTEPFRFADYFLPTTMSGRAGVLVLSLWNMRIHSFRLREDPTPTCLLRHDPNALVLSYPTGNPRVRVYGDNMGGFLDDQRKPSPTYQALLKQLKFTSNFTNRHIPFLEKPSVDYVDNQDVFLVINDGRLRLAIKNLNIIMSTNYDVRGSGALLPSDSFVGEMVVRIRHGAMFMDIDLTEAAADKGFSMESLSKPDLYLGNMEVTFSGNPFDKATEAMTSLFGSYLQENLELVFARIFQQELPRISAMVNNLIEKVVIDTVNTRLAQRSSPLPIWPRLAIEDLRWRVERYRIVVSGFIRHITDIERSDMAALFRHYESKGWGSSFPMAMPLPSDSPVSVNYRSQAQTS